MNAENLCHDCGVRPGEKHHENCDVARCLYTGMQRLCCDGEDHDCGEDVWTGEWPGAKECREFGFWCYWSGGVWPQGRGWVRCSADHPQAKEDLNRLHYEARWDREQQRYVKRKVS